MGAVRCGRVLRVLGDSPCPAVPETVEGLPVTEIGPYCFADRPVRPGARRTGDDTHEITGNFVEAVTLPDTVRTLHSAAFYNCRRLRRLSLGAGVEGWAATCSRTAAALRGCACAPHPMPPTGLKSCWGPSAQTLRWNWTVRSCFTPSIRSFWTRTRPRISSTITLRARATGCGNAFTAAGAVDYAAFDASFAQACVGEGEGALCRLALGRLVLPFALGGQARADYEFYLRAHPAAAFRLAIDTGTRPPLRLLLVG